MPEYWIVNVDEGVIEVRRELRGDGYASITRYARGDVLNVPGFEDVIVPVSDVLPPLHGPG